MNDDYVRDVCRIGAGAACCRYVTMAGGPAGWQCAKGTPLAEQIDARVAAGKMTARGDNCPGANRPVTVMSAGNIERMEDVGEIVVEIGERGDLTSARVVDAAVALVLAREAYPEIKLQVSVGGYDSDPRELWEIPEARDFVELVMVAANHADPRILAHLHESVVGMVGTCLGTMRPVGRDPRTGEHIFEWISVWPSESEAVH